MFQKNDDFTNPVDLPAKSLQSSSHLIVLAGGSGTRLWPESRKDRPKQFLKFFDDRTLLNATVHRVASLVPMQRRWILTGPTLVPLVEESLPDTVESANILVEPVARNTAPCIGFAAVRVLQEDPDATMIVLPADHFIQNEEEFRNAIRFACELVEEEPKHLITFGITPTLPSTSYGYIEQGKILANRSSAFHVKRFHEKPNAIRAEEYLRSGVFYWNSGMFVWKASTILEQIRRFEPEIGHRLDTIAENIGDSSNFPEIFAREFTAMKSVSIDYAVLERSQDTVVLETKFLWDDLGTWTALDRIYDEKHDDNGNLAIDVELATIDSRRNLVKSNDSTRKIALVGVSDLIVIQTDDALLIAKKDAEEKIREIEFE